MRDILRTRRRWTGTIEIVFADDTKLALDEHATGVTELCERIAGKCDVSGSPPT